MSLIGVGAKTLFHGERRIGRAIKGRIRSAKGTSKALGGVGLDDGIKAKATLPPPSGRPISTKGGVSQPPPPVDGRAIQRSSRSVARQVREVRNVNDARALGGRGLSTMREHRVRTGMVVGAGMSVAAAVRNTGSGSAAPQQSLYRY